MLSSDVAILHLKYFQVKTAKIFQNAKGYLAMPILFYC